ncbi:hypothetical protein BH11PLA2_BH11PLA2_02470 [soil metagenome]
MTATENAAWVDYWQTLPEGRLLFAPEAEEFARNLLAAFPLNKSMRVLDFGCGYGSVTARLAPLVNEVRFWDAAASMRDAASRNLKPFVNAISDDEAAGPFDLIVVNSVVQYMSRDELRERLAEWHARLTPTGSLVLSDLIPKSHSSWGDITSLLRFSVRRGYFFTALRNTMIERGRYHKLCDRVPLLYIDPAELERDATAAGFRLRWLPRNLTHFRTRRTAVLTHA